VELDKAVEAVLGLCEVRYLCVVSTLTVMVKDLFNIPVVVAQENVVHNFAFAVRIVQSRGTECGVDIKATAVNRDTVPLYLTVDNPAKMPVERTKLLLGFNDVLAGL
jgi:hypothetical protein